jgi:DNA modification methylase
MAPTRSTKITKGNSTSATPVATHHRRWRVIHSDCLTALPKQAAASIDAVVTDPPYGITAVGMKWDTPRRLDPARPPGHRHSRTNSSVAFHTFCAEWARQCLCVLKPGGHLAAFGSPRTCHLLAQGIEDAGFELRDTLMWIQGNGFPGSRKLTGGRGTGLKPAYEPIILARKPLAGTLDQTLTQHGTGALNIDACRVGLTPLDHHANGRTHPKFAANKRGRWPANLLLSHDHSCIHTGCHPDCPADTLGPNHRFFYCAKANRREREAGCEQLPRSTVQTFKIGAAEEAHAEANPVANIHPTVKPIEIMRWLVRLITPPDGIVLDPFTGSGSTGAAAVLEGARFLGIEREAVYVPIARARITHWSRQARNGATTKPKANRHGNAARYPRQPNPTRK